MGKQGPTTTYTQAYRKVFTIYLSSPVNGTINDRYGIISEVLEDLDSNKRCQG